MSGRRSGGWPVVAVHGVVAVTILALVAVLALVVKPPAPPGIAAFAPSAAKPILKAPLAQSAVFGEGQGQCAAGQVCAHTRPTPTPVPTASLPPVEFRGALPPGLQCYTWPDGSVTQTFDPQSPPCISRWDDSNGNGGATSPGVTATEVHVAFPLSTTPSWPALKPIVDFFNSRFQLYGRTIKIVPFASKTAAQAQTGKGHNDPALQRADAATITTMKVFATFDFIDPTAIGEWSLEVFRDTLTKHRVVSIAGGGLPPYGTASGMAAKAPYEWSYYPTIDALMGNVARMTCRQLAGRPAAHSQDPALASKQRTFALVLPSDSFLGGPLPGLPALLRTLDGCGARPAEIVRYSPGTPDQDAALAASMNRLHSSGVTSVIYFPFSGEASVHAPPSIAAQVRFTPEWAVIGWDSFLTANMLNAPPDQSRGTFGVGMWNRMLPNAQEFWNQAGQATGGPENTQSNVRAFYNEMLLLASGIQMAGPRLTPESFAEGLRSTRFANPGAARAPYYQGTVGFGAGDVSMVDDFLAFWLDTRSTGADMQTAPNTNTHKGFCLVGLGRRETLETWPTTPGFYRGPCR